MAADRGVGGDVSGRHSYSLRSGHSVSSLDLAGGSNKGSGGSGGSSPMSGESICQSPGAYSGHSETRQSSQVVQGKSGRKVLNGGERDENATAASGQQLRGGGGAPAAAGKKRRKKFVGVRQRPSGRWVAEIKDTTQKIRLWLGTFDTAEDAARAYDEAACLLRGSNTRTNFVPHPLAQASPLASKVAQMLHVRRHHASWTSQKPKHHHPFTSSSSQFSASAPTFSPQYQHHDQQLLVRSPSPHSENEDEDNSSLLTSSSSPSLPGFSTGFGTWRDDPSAHHPVAFKSSELTPDMESPLLEFGFHESSLHTSQESEKETEDITRFSQQWKQEEEEEADEEDEEDEEEEESAADEHLKEPSQEHDWIQAQDNSLSNHQAPLNHPLPQRGSYLDAVLGINDDILGSEDIDITSQIESAYYNMSPFDFGADCCSSMHVDDFPLITELSDKLEQAEQMPGNGDITSDHSSELGPGENQLDETIRRMRFERNVSASLYALNGVHELLKQSHHHHGAAAHLIMSSPSTPAASFNFIQAASSPSCSWTSPTHGDSSTSSTTWKKMNLHPGPAPSLPGASTSSVPCSTINFPNLVATENSDPQSQEAMWNSWDLSPLCPLSVA